MDHFCKNYIVWYLFTISEKTVNNQLWRICYVLDNKFITHFMVAKSNKVEVIIYVLIE